MAATASQRKRRLPAIDNSPRTSLLACAALSFFVLAINIGVIAWASTCPSSDDGTQILYRGSCSTTSKANITAHVLINILGTLLLGASNYSMQMAIAPSRADVDKAHKKRRALTIGVPSLRNFDSVSFPRRVCWVLLALSSIPLHLLYNSSILSTKVATEYLVTELDESFLQTGPLTELPGLTPASVAESGVRAGTGYREVKPLFDQILREAHTWENLTLEECAQAYSPFLLASRRTLVLVTPSATEKPTLPGIFRVVGSKTWMCDDPGTVGNPDAVDAGGSAVFPCNPERAMFGSRHRDDFWQEPSEPLFCLAEPYPEDCKVEAFRPFLIVVSIFNAVKFIGMLWLYFHKTAEQSKLNTLGDAIASFLESPDESTHGLCALDRPGLEERWRADAMRSPVRWERRSHRRAYVISRRARIVSAILYLIVICCIIALLSMAISADAVRGPFQPSSFASNQNLAVVGFESLQNATLSGLVILVNLPQFVFSLLYLFYNTLLSLFLQASEWDAFSVRRKPLRVSNPRGSQHSSFWLQVPARYSVPLLIFSAATHWLISQAIFLSRISFLDFLGRPSRRFGGAGYGNIYGAHPGQLLSATYFSPAIIAVLVLSIVALLALVAIAAKKLPGNMVLAASSSVAIAAACHARQGAGAAEPEKHPNTHGHDGIALQLLVCQSPRTTGPEKDSDELGQGGIATQPLMWGDVGNVQERGWDTGIRHLQFSAGEVVEPTEGNDYA
jgi:hypothetical protein